MKRTSGKFRKWQDATLSPEVKSPFTEEEPTGLWAMDPFAAYEFMAAHYGPHSSPEVFGRSDGDPGDDTIHDAVVEPDPVIMAERGSSASKGGEEVRCTTMWMRIEEEMKRRAREAGLGGRTSVAQ